MDELHYPQFQFNPQAEAFVPAPRPVTQTTNSSQEPTSTVSKDTKTVNKIEVCVPSVETTLLIIYHIFQLIFSVRDRLRYELEMIQKDPEEVENVAFRILDEYQEGESFRNEIFHLVLDEIIALVRFQADFILLQNCFYEGTKQRQFCI